MTIEEAKEFIAQSVKSDVDMTLVEDAIKALEQEPCDDCISRQAVIDALNKTSGIRGDALKALYDLPPVTPQLPKINGRKFEEIVVQYPPAELCTYPEYRGKPYFSIKYEENGKHIIGFGTYNPEVLSRYLREYFIATPTKGSEVGE